MRYLPAIVSALALLSACQKTAVDDANLSDINSLRSEYAIGELTWDPALDAKAQTQAEAMASAGGIFHSRNLASGLPEGWQLAGENVASAASLDEAQAALEASPPHLANLVNPSFDSIGIGITRSVDGSTVYVVQIFADLQP